MCERERVPENKRIEKNLKEKQIWKIVFIRLLLLFLKYKIFMNFIDWKQQQQQQQKKINNNK